MHFKNLLLSMATAAMASMAFAAAPPDSTLTQSWNSITNRWDTTSLEIATFDPTSGLKLTSLVKLYTSGQFEPTSRGTFVYNNDGNTVFENYETFVLNAWYPSFRNFLTYNAEGMHVSTRSEAYDPIASAFDTMLWDSTHVVLDAGNRGVSYTDYSWNITTYTMDPVMQKVALSFGSGNLPASFVELNWNGTSFDSISRYTNVAFKTYTGKDLNWATLEDFEAESYNAGTWDKSQKAVSRQTGGKTTGLDLFNWNAGAWEQSLLDSTVYDSHGNRTWALNYSVNTSGALSLQNGTRDSFIYENGDFVKEHFRKIYNVTAGTWENSLWETNFGGQPTGIKIQKPAAATLYPNPVSGTLNIQNQAGKTLQVMDLSGRLLYSTKLETNAVSLDMTAFSEGILLFQFTDENGASYTEKVMHR